MSNLGPVDGLPSRRDRKKSATRHALRWAALDLVAERGYAHVTVEEIAEAADVSTRTFFNYFSSKEDAVVGQDPELLLALRADVLGRPADESAFEALQAVLRRHVAHIALDAGGVAGENDAARVAPAEWARRIKAVHADPQLRAAFVTQMAMLERTLAEAVATRLGCDVESDPFPALLAAASMAACRVAVMYWSKGDLSVVSDRSRLSGTPETLATAAFAELAAGLVGTGELVAAFAELRAVRRPAGAPDSSALFRRASDRPPDTRALERQ